MSGFFEELKRRKVYRVAIAYAVAGWRSRKASPKFFLFSTFQIPLFAL